VAYSTGTSGCDKSLCVHLVVILLCVYVYAKNTYVLRYCGVDFYPVATFSFHVIKFFLVIV